MPLCWCNFVYCLQITLYFVCVPCVRVLQSALLMCSLSVATEGTLVHSNLLGKYLLMTQNT